MTGAARFRHKPTVVEAARWTGDNEAEVKALAGDLFTLSHPVQAAGGVVTGAVYDRLHETWIGVKTGQWVARGTKGEFWPIDHVVMCETYDPADGVPDGVDLGNWQGVGRDGAGKVHVALPRAVMTREQALVHAAWIVAVAAADDGEFAAYLDAVRGVLMAEINPAPAALGDEAVTPS